MSLPSTSYLSPTVGTGPATPSGSTASSTTDLPRPSKRALRPTLSDSFGVTGAGTSALTSSEIAAAKYGVDDETTRHLAAMAMRVRQRESRRCESCGIKKGEWRWRPDNACLTWSHGVVTGVICVNAWLVGANGFPRRYGTSMRAVLAHQQADR